MKIETKYNIGDKAWRMAENKVMEDSIHEIVIRVKPRGDAPPHVEESYILNYGGGGFTTDRFYPTKEELLASL